ESPASAEANAVPTAPDNGGGNNTGPYSVELRVLQGATVVRDWAAPATFDGTTFTDSLAGLAPNAYTLEARLLQGTQLVASDAHGFTAGDRAPTVSAGSAQTVNEGATTTLAGSASDADGDPLTT